MKISSREKNTFQGSYYGYHDEMDAKSAPLYVKINFILLILVVLGGVGLAFYNIQNENIEWFVKSIILTISVEFILIHLFAVLFDIAKYGKVRKQAKVIGSIFTSTGILLLGGMLLSGFFNFFVVLSVGIAIVFISIGAGLWLGGIKKLKRMNKSCTQSVLATCIGFEELDPHMPILNDDNASFAQNEVVARAKVIRPIWEFDYNGLKYRATPEEYQGKQKIAEGQQYQIYINPNDPQQIYCEDSSDARFLISMGKIWTAFTVLIIIILIVAMYFVLGVK